MKKLLMIILLLTSSCSTAPDQTSLLKKLKNDYNLTQGGVEFIIHCDLIDQTTTPVKIDDVITIDELGNFSFPLTVTEAIPLADFIEIKASAQAIIKLKKNDKFIGIELTDRKTLLATTNSTTDKNSVKFEFLVPIGHAVKK